MNIVGVALQAKWDKIALELKITAEEISAIQVNHHGKPDFAQDCMMDSYIFKMEECHNKPLYLAQSGRSFVLCTS